jgi:hypothetical protein
VILDADDDDASLPGVRPGFQLRGVSGTWPEPTSRGVASVSRA